MPAIRRLNLLFFPRYFDIFHCVAVCPSMTIVEFSLMANSFKAICWEIDPGLFQWCFDFRLVRVFRQIVLRVVIIEFLRDLLLCIVSIWSLVMQKSRAIITLQSIFKLIAKIINMRWVDTYRRDRFRKFLTFISAGGYLSETLQLLLDFFIWV